MRVLFTAWAWSTHAAAMVPLAWALRAAGHEVGFAVPAQARDVVARWGLPVAAVGHDPGSRAMIAEVVRAESVVRAGSAALPAAPPVTVPRSVPIFAAICDAMADDLLAHARAFRPDVVVTDPTAQAGVLVAAALGVPALRHPWFADIAGALAQRQAVRDAEVAALAPVAARLGVDPALVRTSGDATLDPCPPSLGVPVPGPRHPVRYVPFHGRYTGPVPEALAERADRSRVCLTWGGTVAAVDPARVPLARLAGALAAHGFVPVLVAPPEQLPAALPATAVVAPSARLSDVLPHCSAVVGHGGAGTLMTAVLHGLPQLALPLLPDHRFNASRLAASGAGTVLDPAAPGDEVAAAVAALLADPGPRERALAVAAEVVAAPSPARVAADWEAIVGGARTRVA